MPLRIAIAQIYQETNTFSPRLTTLEDFRCRFLHSGPDVLLNMRGTRTETGGIIDALEAASAEIVPLVAAWAMPGGRVDEACFETLREQLLGRLRATLPVDAVVLSLHGAMCAVDCDDADGTILAQVRELVGAQTPLHCALDWHANLTDQMLEAADFIIGYRTFPHEDLYETGHKAACSALHQLREGVSPAPVHKIRLPLIPQAVTSGSANEPMRGILARIAELEAAFEGCAPSIFLTQPWLDLPDFACTAILYSQEAEAVQRFDELVDELWQRRKELDGNWPGAADAIDAALEPGHRPAILIDLGNVVLAGAPGMNTELVQALVRHPKAPSAVATICAPTALDVLLARRPGESVSVSLDGDNSGALTIEGRLVRICDTSYRLRGPYLAGVEFSPGPRALVECGNLQLVVSRFPESAQDPAYYTSMGIAPDAAQIVVVKSHNTFKPSYADLSTRYVYADTFGPAAANPARLPYERLPRPLYPLDPDTSRDT